MTCVKMIMTAEADEYGQHHPIETEERIATAITEMDTALSLLDANKKNNWEEAKTKCPLSMVDDSHKRMFLRTDVYEIDLAVKRLVQYWDKRVELFGKEKAFMPLTLSALKDEDMIALTAGFSTVMEGTDESGRGIFMVNPSKKDLSKYSRVAMVRAIWYMVHAMLESHESIQQKGVVVIICSRDAKLSHFDRKLDDMILQSLKGVLPMRISVFHICQPPTVFALVFPFLRMMIGPRLRKKIKVHSDSTDNVLEQLARYGLSKNILPAELGGMKEVDSVKWLEARKKAEE